MPVVGAGTRLAIEPWNGFEIVIHHVRRALRENIERKVQAAAEVRNQNFDRGSRRMPAHRGYAVAEMLCSAVAQIVAVDAGNDNVTKLERRNGAGEIDRIRRV